MNWYLTAAALLAFFVGLVHSILGEHLIFRKMRAGTHPLGKLASRDGDGLGNRSDSHSAGAHAAHEPLAQQPCKRHHRHDADKFIAGVRCNEGPASGMGWPAAHRAADSGRSLTHFS